MGKRTHILTAEKEYELPEAFPNPHSTFYHQNDTLYTVDDKNHHQSGTIDITLLNHVHEHSPSTRVHFLDRSHSQKKTKGTIQTGSVMLGVTQSSMHESQNGSTLYSLHERKLREMSDLLFQG